MDSIRFFNYRCFSDSGNIKIYPINILVGANSSGKSSFLKFFPLLQQSVGRRLNGVFSWLGDNVDFKSFSNTVRDGESNMMFEYSTKRLDVVKMYRRVTKNGLGETLIKFHVVPKSEHFDRIDFFSVTFEDETCMEFYIDEKDRAKILINSEEIYIPSKGILKAFRTESLFPRFDIHGSIDEDITHDCENKIRELLIKIDSDIMHSRRLSALLSMLPVTKVDFVNKASRVLRINIQTEVLDDLYKWSLIYSINSIIDSLNYNILSVGKNVTYIKPLRSIAERYYRYQNYAIDKIDSDGANLPMYLFNQAPEVQQAFNDWLKTTLDIEFFAEPHEGHIEMMISYRGGPKRNLVDVGFGYSQILPIIALIWNEIYLNCGHERGIWNNLRDEHIIVIEQPELHLHPRMQGLFVRMLIILVRICKEQDLDVRFIIETHSETVLNKLGHYVSIKELRDEDIQVLLFKRDIENGNKITTTSYNADGYLEQWPLDFFDDGD